MCTVASLGNVPKIFPFIESLTLRALAVIIPYSYGLFLGVSIGSTGLVFIILPLRPFTIASAIAFARTLFYISTSSVSVKDISISIAGAIVFLIT